MLRYEIVSLEWAMIDVASQFCRKYNIPHGKGANAIVLSINKIPCWTVHVRMEILELGHHSSICIQLKQDGNNETWRAYGELVITLQGFATFLTNEVDENISRHGSSCFSVEHLGNGKYDFRPMPDKDTSDHQCPID